MTENEIIRVIKERTYESEGRTRLTCSIAHEIAAEHEISLSVIGRLCNGERIKISACELGCFS